MNRYGVDLMAINETWIKEGEADRAPVVPGYRLRYVPRPEHVRGGRGGGVGFYIRRGVSARTWAHPQDPRYKTVEQFWVTLNVNGKKLAVGTAYRPPKGVKLDLFLDAITDSINSLSGFDNIVLMGDFNVDLLVVECSSKKLSTVLSCLHLTQVVSDPTHFTDHSQTLIDLICTDLKARRVSVESVGTLNGHALITCEFYVNRAKHIPYTVTYRPLKNIEIERFDNDLKLFRWDLISEIDEVNKMLKCFSDSILAIFEVHAPKKCCTIRERSYPWITDNVKFMMRLRDDALKAYRKSKSENKKTYYKDLKVLVTQSLHYEKVAYYKHSINNKIHMPKTLWKNLKSTILPPKNDASLPMHFDDADAINKHFLCVPGSLTVSVSLLTFFEFHRLNDRIFSLVPVNADSIFKIIKSLKSNAEGFDGITLDMLLLTLPLSLETITAIVNTSISTSTFPNDCKIAIVRPLPKINNPCVLKELRPISILPCISKIIEKAVCRQLTDFLEKYDILPDSQSGFRKNRSTATALSDVTDNILFAQDQGMCTLLVLLDFSRAFDAINTTLLLSKLRYYGFDPATLNWFDSYLSDRYQYVELKNSNGSSLCSQLSPLNRGVPQGSILGPILFILFSADIGNQIENCKYHIYADDVQVYLSFRPHELSRAIVAINEDLCRISAWSDANGLVLNPLKTKFMILGSKHHVASLHLDTSVLLKGEPVERVFEARNLGLSMDADLRFEKHVVDCVRNCFYRLKILYKIRPYLSEEVRIHLVESLVLSKLNYADTVYGPRLLARTQHLVQRVQNACARFCFVVPPRSHITPFLNKHYSLKMKSRRKLHLACLLFGVINYETPKYLYEKLSWMTSKRSCGSRQCSTQLSTQHHRSESFRGSFRYAASRCWNNLPPPIRNAKSIHNFRHKLKKYLIEGQIRHGNINIDISLI